MKPNSANLKKLLAHAESHLGKNQIAEAIEVLTTASRLTPKSMSVWINLGQAYLRFGKLEAALSCFGKAVQLDETNASAVAGYAGALMSLGEFEQAIQLFEKVIALDEEQVPYATASIAEALEKLGRPEEAYEKLVPFTGRGSLPSCIVLSFSQIVLQDDQFASEQEKAIGLLEKIVNDAGEDKVVRARACFKLGHLYRKIKDYEKSFLSFQAAHELLGVVYDLSELSENIDRLKQKFSVATNEHAVAEKYKNIFVLGLPRSGTSLVEKIVGVNEEVSSLGECNFFHQAVCEVSSDEDVLWGCKAIGGADLKRVGMLYKQQYLVSGRPSRYVCDKSLENVFLVGQILQVFPEARMVWTKRDLRDVCLSCYSSDFAGRHSYTHDLKVLGEYARMIEGLMLYWVDLFPQNFHVVEYERLVESPDRGIKDLIDFLGFEWDESYLDFHRSENRVKTISYSDVQKPVYKHAVGKWVKYENWLAPLFEGLACK